MEKIHQKQLESEAKAHGMATRECPKCGQLVAMPGHPYLNASQLRPELYCDCPEGADARAEYRAMRG